MSFPFENLEVYKRSLDWVEQVEVILLNHRDRISRQLGDQLSRAALSIPLNIAEGNGRWHKAEKRNFFWIARGSTFECVPIIEILKRKEIISQDQSTFAKDQLTVLGKMLTNLVKAHE